jgi:hypothetical protein
MNIAKKTKEYLQNHWLLREAIKKNIANNSKLARLIAKDLGLNPVKDFHAVLVTCRRYAEKLKFAGQEQKIIDLLKKSKLHIKTKLAQVVLERSLKPSALHFIRGENSNTIIIDGSELEKIKQSYKYGILHAKKDLAEVLIISPKQVEETIGVSAYLSSLLADAEINVLTLIGSYDEDIFIIEQKDVAKVLQILDNIIK